MAGSDPIAWDLGNAPKQSITEVLQNPRGSSLELPDLPSFDLSTPAPSPLPPPPNINDFEAYLRRYTPLLAAFAQEKELLYAPDHESIAIPKHYYDTHFNVCENPDLTDVALRLQPAETSRLREKLAKYRTELETTLQSQLAQQREPIADALAQIRTLRAQILATASALRIARTQVETLLPSVTTGLCTARSLTAVQKNVRALRVALQSVRDLLSAPDDVATLLHTAEYAAAIDTVERAKNSLNGRELSAVLALAPARGRLAQAVEGIDAALREEFRIALREGASGEETLRHVVELEHRMGRVPLLRAFFLKELKTEISEQVQKAKDMGSACRLVKKGAGQVLTLLRIVDMNHGRKGALEDLEEMLINAVDRFMGTGGEAGFVFMLDIVDVGLENCFDEFKNALRFAEEVRVVEETAKEVQGLFGVDGKSNALRAKIAERQLAFVGAFHRAHVDVLNNTLRGDKWQELIVPQGVLRLLGAVIDDNAVNEVRKGGDGVVVIDGQAFKTVASGVRYVMSMCTYVLLAEKASNMAPEVARRATELSRMFNSLVGKAILGAAALQWSGLKSITARHLSLASRTVAMAAALADRINTPLEHALSDAQKGVIAPLMQKSEKDLRDHHGQLLAKILAIMIDRLQAHEEVLKSLPWDKAQEMKRYRMPSDYMNTVVKEATVLHRILWSVLPRMEVCDIFQRVCAAYGTHLTEAYGELDGGKRWVRARVAEDVACLHDQMKALDIFQEHPVAFKPITKLYIRFAKEYFDLKASGGAGGGIGRTFIRRKEERHPSERAPTVKTDAQPQIIENQQNQQKGSGNVDDIPKQQDETAEPLPCLPGEDQSKIVDLQKESAHACAGSDIRLEHHPEPSHNGQPLLSNGEKDIMTANGFQPEEPSVPQSETIDSLLNQNVVAAHSRSNGEHVLVPSPSQKHEVLPEQNAVTNDAQERTTSTATVPEGDLLGLDGDSESQRGT